MRINFGDWLINLYSFCQKALSDLQANDPVVRRRLLCPAKTSMSGQDLYVRLRPLCPATASMFDDDLYVRPRALCTATTSMSDHGLYARRRRPLCSTTAYHFGLLNPIPPDSRTSAEYPARANGVIA